MLDVLRHCTAAAALPGVGKWCLGKDAIFIGRIPVQMHQPPPQQPGIAQSCHFGGVISMSHGGRADQISLGGSGSGSSRTENSSPHQVRLPPRPIWTQIWQQHQWGAGRHLGVYVPISGKKHHARRDSLWKHQHLYGWGMCARKSCRWTNHTVCQWFQILLGVDIIKTIQDIRTRCSQELPSRMAENGKKYIAYTTSAKSWRLCVLASLPTSGPALRDVQIEQWSINQRALTKYTAFLHTGCIFELGIGMPLSSVL